MPSSADVYLEKLAAVRAAEEEVIQAIRRLAEAAEAFRHPSGESWRSMTVPGISRPVSRAARAPKRSLPDWPTRQEVERCLATYQKALGEVGRAYSALNPVEKAGVQLPPEAPE